MAMVLRYGDERGGQLNGSRALTEGSDPDKHKNNPIAIATLLLQAV